MASTLQELIKAQQTMIELPKLLPTDVAALKARDAVLKALPPISTVGTDPLVGYSTKAADAAQLAQNIGAAYDTTRSQLKRNREVSKKEDKLIERMIRSQGRNFSKRLDALHRNKINNRNRFTKRFAADLLGIDTSLYKIL